MQMIRTLEDFREHLFEERHDYMNYAIENLEESTEYLISTLG